MNEPFEITKNQTKRDIFRLEGDKPTAINLEHVTMMQIDKNRIIFTFQANNLSIDLSDEDKAKQVYEALINLWASDSP